MKVDCREDEQIKEKRETNTQWKFYRVPSLLEGKDKEKEISYL